MNSGHVYLSSRSGLTLNAKFSLIADSLKKLKVKSAILDGEIVVLDELGVPRFELLQRFQRDGKGALIYYVFDLLCLNGENLISVPLVRRRETLGRLVPKEGPIRFSQAIDEQGIEFFRAARERG
jgi:bifunctional non-homologous end joining protein LigD